MIANTLHVLVSLVPRLIQDLMRKMGLDVFLTSTETLMNLGIAGVTGSNRCACALVCVPGCIYFAPV